MLNSALNYKIIFHYLTFFITDQIKYPLEHFLNNYYYYYYYSCIGIKRNREYRTIIFALLDLYRAIIHSVEVSGLLVFFVFFLLQLKET